MMEKRSLHAATRLAAVAAAAALVVGCGLKEDDPVTVAAPGGAVVQGPVSGAIVFADRIPAGQIRGNGIVDADEKAYSTTTDSTGNWKLTAVPTYDYEIVSLGGTDTITSQPAITMRAEGGKAGQTVTSQAVTPLTTLVQLTPEANRAALKTTIQSLGVAYNAKIDEGITPAAAALVKAVTTTASMVVEVLNTAAGGNDNTRLLSTQAVKSVQTEVLAALATNLVGKIATQLDTGAEIASITQAATTSAVTAMAADSSKAGGVTLALDNAAITQVAQSVATSTTTVVDAIATATSSGNGPLATTAASIKPEAQIVTQNVSAAIETQTSASAAQQTLQNVTVTVTPPTNTAPTITGAASASGTVGVAFTYTPTVADAESDLLTLSITGSKAIPPGLTFNPLTGAITGVPTASGTGTYSITVSDGRQTASLSVTLTFTRTTGATGATF
jgi:hypothetical protein